MAKQLKPPPNIDDSIIALWWSTDVTGKNVVKELLSGKSRYLNLRLAEPKACTVEVNIKVGGHEPKQEMNVTITTNAKGFGNVLVESPVISGF